jgi:hypothetical protein
LHQHSYSARTDFGEGYDRVTKLQYVKNTVSHKSSVPSTGSDNTRTIWDVWDTICITVISSCKTIFFRPIFRFRPLLACREPPQAALHGGCAVTVPALPPCARSCPLRPAGFGMSRPRPRCVCCCCCCRPARLLRRRRQAPLLLFWRRNRPARRCLTRFFRCRHRWPWLRPAGRAWCGGSRRC